MVNSTPIFTGVACDQADKVCYCSSKGAAACNAVPNSACDATSDSCKCKEDFFNNGGVCTATPSRDYGNLAILI